MKRRFAGVALEIWLPVVAILAWWITSANSTSVYFPPLSHIVQAFRDNWLFARVGSDVLPSMIRFLAGTAIGVAAGIGFGVVIGLSPRLRQAVNPFIDFFRSLPKPALLPVAIVALGVGDSMKIFIIAFGTIWPVLLNTIDGVRGVDEMLIDFSRVYGLTRRQRITNVILPSASPQIFVGARLALSIGLILMVVSEMVASTSGLGYFVLLSQQTFSIPNMWAGIILLGIIGYLTNLVFLVVERRVLAWHAGWRATALGESAPLPARRRRLVAMRDLDIEHPQAVDSADAPKAVPERRTADA